MACEAKWRRRIDAGWVCEGAEGVPRIYLMDGPKGIPVVGPESALADFMAEPQSDVYHPRPFTGGDHLHACMPGRKPAESQR